MGEGAVVLVVEVKVVTLAEGVVDGAGVVEGVDFGVVSFLVVALAGVTVAGVAEVVRLMGTLSTGA